ncbi:hypothetical protein FGB62_22g215 [Gracilaria domingensis]|nr:hypothetical protein FGB62_22g215 [Gracilaria domingensis]
MIVLAFLTSPAFTGKNFGASGRCKFHLANHAKRKISIFSDTMSESSKTLSVKVKQMNARGYNEQTDGPPPSDIGESAEKRAQYSFFSEQLGMSNDINLRPDKTDSLQSKVIPADSNILLNEAHAQSTGEVEIKDRVELNPAEYELFDQLLQSTGGTGRKAVKGSKAFTSVEDCRKSLRKTSKSSKMFRDRSIQMGEAGKKPGQDIRRVSDSDNGVKGPSEKLDSGSLSYELMREEFGEGFHGLGQRRTSNNTSNKVSETSPPAVLQQRPRRPSHMEGTIPSSTTEVSVSSYDEVCHAPESMKKDVGEPSETTALAAESYDLMREKFGVGLWDGIQSPKSSDIEKQNSAVNASPVLQERPKHPVHRERLPLGNNTKATIAPEVNNTIPGSPPPVLNTPPQRRPPVTENNDTGRVPQQIVKSLADIQSECDSSLRERTASSLRTNDDTDLSQRNCDGLLSILQVVTERDDVPTNVVETIEDANELLVNTQEMGYSTPYVLKEEVSNTLEGFNMDYKADEKLPLLSRPARREQSEDKKLLAISRLRGSKRFSSKGRVRRPIGKAYVLGNPKFVCMRIRPSVQDVQ